jgi:hypothetical protein
MPEQEPQTTQPNERWSSRQIADALGVPAQSTGESQPEDRGARYNVGERTRLEVYPQQGLVRVNVPGAAILLAAHRPPAIGEHAVVFKSVLTGEGEQRELGLSVNRSGDVFFAYMPAAPEQPETDTPAVSDTPAKAPEQAPATPSSTNRPESPEVPKRRPSGHSRAQDATPDKREAPPRVKLSGKVTYYRYLEPTDPEKAPSLQLTVAYPEGDATRYTHVYTTKDRARTLKEAAKLGDQVDIVGWPQQQTRRLPDGSERQETVVYALGIKKVNPQDTQP